MKSNKGLFAFIFLLGLGSLSCLIVVNPWLLGKFTADGHLEDYYKKKIVAIQTNIIIEAIFFITVGFLGYKFSFFNFLTNKPKQINRYLAGVLFLWSIFHLEMFLRIKPQLSTNEVLDMSLPYEPAIFCRHKYPKGTFTMKNIGGSENCKLVNGYHNKPFPVEKPKDEIRIVVIGGSHIFGDFEEFLWSKKYHNRNWVEKVENKMHEAGRSNVRVINAGIMGHASFDSFGRIYSEIHLFKPDYILLCNAWNDIKYFRDISPENSLLRMYNALPASTHQYKSGIANFLEKFQIYLRLENVFSGAIDEVGEKGLKVISKDIEGAITDTTLSSKYSPYGIQQYNLTLKLFIDLCREINATPVVVTQPLLITLNNTEEEKRSIQYGHVKLTHEAIYRAKVEIDSSIKQICHEKNAICFDMASKYTGNKEIFVDQVHFNVKGGEIIASEYARFLDSLLSQNQSQIIKK